MGWASGILWKDSGSGDWAPLETWGAPASSLFSAGRSPLDRASGLARIGRVLRALKPGVPSLEDGD